MNVNWPTFMTCELLIMKLHAGIKVPVKLQEHETKHLYPLSYLLAAAVKCHASHVLGSRDLFGNSLFEAKVTVTSGGLSACSVT